MALNGIIFDERDNKSKDWRNILKKILPDGILRGCNISYTSNSITVGDGYLVACGGVVQCDGAETLSITPQIANGYVRLKLRVDLSQEASSTSSNQTSWAQDYSATTTFPDLVQEDIGGNGLIYEIMVCIAQITGSNITGITETTKSYSGSLNIDGGTMSGDITLAPGCRIKGTQYGTGKPIGIIWLGNSANDNIWIGGNNGEATIGGGIYFHIGEGKQMKLIRGTDASVEMLDAGNYAPGNCSAGTQNQYSNGTHTHAMTITNTMETAYNGTLYLGYTAREHKARLAGYYDAASGKDYAQLALTRAAGEGENPETRNAVNVYDEAVEIQKDLDVNGNANVKGALYLPEKESLVFGKNWAGENIVLMRSGINAVDNLWIGTGDTKVDAPSHDGSTYISAGRAGKIYAVVKKAAADGTGYEMIHTGNAANLLSGTFSATGHTHASIQRSGSNRAVGIAGDYGSFRTYKVDDSTWSTLDNTMNLGTSDSRWKQLYAGTTTIATSDARMKEEIADIDKARELILNLKPRQFKMTDGESGRIHYGMIAQEVKEAMTAAGIEDFGGYVRSPLDEKGDPKTAAEEDVRYGLRYDEFIAPLIATVQAQQKQIEELTQRVEALENAK